MMQTLTDIWTKRAKWLENKTWRGSDPKSGFDYSQPINAHLPYTNDNWNDLSIEDLRSVLTDLTFNDFPERLSIDHFDITYEDTVFKSTILTSKVIPNQPYGKDDPKIKIIASRIEEQPQCTIYTKNGVFSVSWYKSRGRIDSFINTEYGHPATLENITDILVALKLEKPYADDRDNNTL